MTRFSTACLSALSLSLLVSCQPPLGTPQDSAQTTGGSLSLTVSHMAPWLETYAATGKALLYATSVQVSIKGYGNVDVIAPVTLAVSAAPGSASTVLPVINSIPAGYGYTVTVSVYNSVNSATVAVTEGTATNVWIRDGQTCTLKVTCKPLTPAALTLGAGPWTATLALQSEAWYTVPFTSGNDYTISQTTSGMGTFLFDSNGTYLLTVPDASSRKYSCATTGTYYIGIAATVAGTSSLNISSVPTPWNEGSAAAPVAVALDTSRGFRVGCTASDYDSFYSFRTAAAGVYFLDAEWGGSDLVDVSVYADSGFSSLLTTLPASPYGGSLGSLAGSTTYYIKVHDGTGTMPIVFQGMVASPAYQAANSSCNGTISSPASLSLGIMLIGSVGKHSWDCTSYYTFMSGATTAHQFSAVAKSILLFSRVRATLYSDSAFSSAVAGSMQGDNFTTPFTLTPSTRYYLKVENLEMRGDYSLGCSVLLQTFQPKGESLSTTVPGVFPPSTSELWYEVAVTGGSSYNLSLYGYEADSVSFTAWPVAYVYGTDRTTLLKSADDTGTPVAVAAPSGQDKLYIRIASPSLGGTGNFAFRLAP